MEAHEVELYRRMVREHRGTSRQIGAGSVESQEARFVVIRDVLDSMLGRRWLSMRLLDFGCGKGDLAAWLQRHCAYDCERNYVGIDAIAENIRDAHELGDFDFRVQLWDGTGPLLSEPADLIVFSGTMNTTRLELRLAMFRQLLQQAKVGVVGNFLMSSGIAKKPFAPESILLEPDRCLREVDRDQFRVQLRADYLPHCFTVGAIRWEIGDCEES